MRWVVNRRIHNQKTGAGDGRTHLTMLHAWIWSDNPSGVFALEHTGLPYLRAGLPAELAQSADGFAPYGIALLDDRGCEWEIGKIKLLARATTEQQRTLLKACHDAADRVRGSSIEKLNGEASAAWREFLRMRDVTLSAEQRGRLGVGVEHH